MLSCRDSGGCDTGCRDPKMIRLLLCCLIIFCIYCFFCRYDPVR